MENKALVLDLIEWVAARPRTYAEVMDAWRTSCPRLQIWEDATDRGFVLSERRSGSETIVSVTGAGRAFLDVERPGWRDATRAARSSCEEAPSRTS
ncbi:MAG TPA: hypothetical protein VFP63_08175 [Dehalococcoidia bacterium]|nr:hypothetical protein [Dehalococcoidia bacterium]